MDEELIQAQAMAARIVCLRMTAQHLKTLHDSVDQASRLPARSQWDRKAAAHAEIFSLLAAAAGPVPSEALHVAADLVHDLMLAVGPAAGGMIASSRRRLLAHMAAGRADEAALEMEKHLRGLHYMSRLARRPLGRVTARLPWPVSAGEGLGFDDDGGEHEDQHGRCHPCRPRTQSTGIAGESGCFQLPPAAACWLAARAADRISWVTSSGWLISERWPESISTVVAFMRLARKR